MMHVRAATAEILGAGLPRRVRLMRDLPQIGARAGMIFKHTGGCAWVHPDLKDGLLASRVRKMLDKRELMQLPAIGLYADVTAACGGNYANISAA